MNQDKNIIKAIVAVAAAAIIGEGILGLGLYWSFLLLLVEWDGVFWLTFFIGILVGSFSGIPVGFASLFMLVSVGFVHVFAGWKKGTSLELAVFSVVLNFAFDKIFGLRWSIGEMALVFICAIVVFGRESKSESIRVRYK